ncbi:hypothetical protein RB195_015994 [Necator americanus]|uniref:Uncharacterized protein n=1 Tax=Necator americanus TaxID=51031 RepID=A0ABR1E895_NECAM
MRARIQEATKTVDESGIRTHAPEEVPKTSALDRSAISPTYSSKAAVQMESKFSTVPHACQNSHEAPGLTKTVDESGIRTHAPEGTGALNQRLGPLGHLATSQFRKAAVQMEFPDFPQFHMRARIRMRHQGSPKQLTRVGFEPTPPKGLVPKTSALDRSAISPYILVEGSSSNGIPRFSTVPHPWQNSHEAPGLTKTVDESGIRTHAPEGTGALNQRLGPLGHLATSRAAICNTVEGSSSNGIPRFSTVPHACQNSHEAPGLTKTVDESGIRTHAPEGTGALNQRLGPLGHLATSQFRKAAVQMEFPDFPQFHMRARIRMRHQGSPKQLTRTARPSRHTYSSKAAVQMEFPDFPQFHMRARIRMRHQGSPKQLTRVGFEPTPPKGLVPKTSALDRSAISPYILVEGSSSNGIPRFSTVPHACQNSHEAPGLTKTVDESGFEPTPPKGLVPKTSALDRSAISPYILVEGSSSNGITRFSTVPHACQNSHEAPGLTKTVDESGIRTHAPEGTGALNQRLGPLGHLATSQFRKAAVQMEFPDFPQFHMRARIRMRHQGRPKQLTRVGFEPTPPKGLVP